MQTQIDFLFNVAEVELIYKTKVKASDRPKITSSRDAYELLQKIYNRDTVELREEFYVLLVNRAHRVLGVYNLSKGGVSGTVADPKLIFASALKANASGIIASHNHPSGNLTPSQADKDLTRKIKEGGKLLDIQLLDHIIYTVDGYYSMADEGLI